jgi:hypothetical protein
MPFSVRAHRRYPVQSSTGWRLTDGTKLER